MPHTSETGAGNLHWATALLRELAAHGVTYACLSPGSRCTPLTVAAAHSETIETLVHYDERGAAFHALGYARATGRPAVLISTSGTAVANYLPAGVEASVGHVPLLVITSDRPPELRQTGANQPIDQVRIFGDYTRWYFELPCPTSDIDVDMVRSTAAQAVYRSHGAPAGPVPVAGRRGGTTPLNDIIPPLYAFSRARRAGGGPGDAGDRPVAVRRV